MGSPEIVNLQTTDVTPEKRGASLRASTTAATGTSGQSALKATFERLGWAAIPNPEHDLGTDLWVNPRDPRRYDLGLMLGVQVKNGPTGFKRPGDVGGRTGWWHSNDRRHWDYWLQHYVPHLVVLRDEATGVSYWAHVNKDSVEWTGKHGKMFVPSDQVVDEDSLSALIEIAASVRPAPQWSGTAWSGADLTPSTELRHALLAPRLVAPHPNAPLRRLRAPEAIALLAAGRFGEIDRYHLNETDGSRSGWAWSMYSGILDWVMSGSVDQLRSCAAGAVEPHELAAASVVLASALVEADAWEEALEVVVGPLEGDLCDPIDHAWLQIHRARCLAEIGDPDEAIRLGVSVQGLPTVHPGDLTAAAIAGSGASLVFRTSDLLAGDVSSTIRAGDTETNWWRSQSISWGLGAFFDETFRRWVDNQGEISFSRDSGVHRLRGVSLVAAFTALHEGWCHAISLLAKWELMSPSLDSDAARDRLVDLCRAGDAKALAGAIPQLLVRGPASAVARAGALVDLDCVTRTSARATLELLTRGADLLPIAAAEAAAGWALRSREDLERWRNRVRPAFVLDWQRAGLLAALVGVVSADTQSKICAHVVGLPMLSDQGNAHQWAAVVRAVPPSAWTADEVEALLGRSGDHREFTDAVTSLDSRRDRARREAVLDQLREGSFQAITYLDSITEVPEDAVDPLTLACAKSIRHRIEQANSGQFARYVGVDPARTLVLLNVAFPAHANWEPVLDLLGNQLAYEFITGGAIEAIAGNVDDIDAAVVAKITDALKGLVGRGPLPMLPLLGGDARSIAMEALHQLEPPKETPLGWLAARGRTEREHLIRLLAQRRDPADTGVLVTLTSDSDPYVRALAAGALSYWLSCGVATVDVLKALTRALADDSTLMARTVVKQWPVAPVSSLRPLAEFLASHQSAKVRNRAALQLRA